MRQPTTLPLRWAVWALNFWMNWPGFTPCWPRAGPMGGAGVAVPPGAWILNWTVISFFAMAVTGNESGVGADSIDDLLQSTIFTSICRRGRVGAAVSTTTASTGV